MTPFGARIRQLRLAKGVTLANMAKDIGTSSAYLSALEHGKRGRPSWYLVQRIIAYFNVIWDEAELLTALARISHPKVTLNTAGLSPMATELANRLALQISELSDDELQRLLESLPTRRRERR